MIETFQTRSPHRAPPASPGLLGLLGALALAVAAAACHDGPAAIGANEMDPEGALVGQLESFVVDREDGPSTRESYLVLSDPAATRLRLDFDGLVAPTGSGALRAWGVRRGESLRVLHYEADVVAGDQGDGAGIGRATSELVGSSPKPRTAVFVIVDIGAGSKLTNDVAASTVFTPGKNFADVYNQLSYGIIQMSGTVVGPLSYPTSTCDYNGVARALRPMIQGTYNHYMWYFASNPGCAWSGLGAEGNVTRPQADSWYNASTGCTVLVQEVGHNLGWMHSSTLRCPGASFADNPLTCTSSEYGNRYTPMGSGCGHFAAYDKWYGGIFSGCNGVKVTASGTFNLLPIESACNGVQGIQIPMIKTTRTADPQQGNPQPLKHYYIEYRGPWGLDTAIKTPQVMVYAGDDVHAASKTSNWTWLLDMSPSTTNTFDGLAVGQAFSDPTDGITVTVMSADASKAVVQIDITGGIGAPPTCIDNTTLADAGPVECSAIPGLGGATGSTTGTGGAGTGAGGARAGTGGTLGGNTGTGGRGIFGGTGGFSFGSGGSGASGTPTPGTGGRPFGLGTGGAAAPTGSGGAATISGSGGATGTGDGPGTGGQGSGADPGTVVIGPGTIGPTGNGGGAPGPLGLGAAGSVNGGCTCALGPDGQSAGWPAVLVVLALVGLASRRRPARSEPATSGPGSPAAWSRLGSG
jgi:MYXO-CTERM domain-containing protein